MNASEVHDRVTEAYLGMFGSVSFMRHTQARIHWICRQVEGEKVADIGASQGIATILLAREGKQVLAVDSDAKVVGEAKEYLAAEPQRVQDRVKIVEADALAFAFKTGAFDTVILAEILEHLTQPESMVKVASACLKKRGRVVVTVPFGINDFIDHKITFYLSSPVHLLHRYFEITEIEVIDNWLGITGIRRDKPAEEPPVFDAGVLANVEKKFEEVERRYGDRIGTLMKNLSTAEKRAKTASDQLVETRNKAAAADRQAHLKSAEVQQLQKEAEHAEKRVADLEAALAGLRADLAKANGSTADAETNLALLNQAIGHALALLVSVESRWASNADQAFHAPDGSTPTDTLLLRIQHAFIEIQGMRQELLRARDDLAENSEALEQERRARQAEAEKAGRLEAELSEERAVHERREQAHQEAVARLLIDGEALREGHGRELAALRQRLAEAEAAQERQAADHAGSVAALREGHGRELAALQQRLAEAEAAQERQAADHAGSVAALREGHGRELAALQQGLAAAEAERERLAGESTAQARVAAATLAELMNRSTAIARAAAETEGVLKAQVKALSAELASFHSRVEKGAVGLAWVFPRRVGAALRAGNRARDSGRWADAARHYRQALQRSPELSAIWVQLGHALKEQSDYNGAETAYRRSLAIDASVPDTHLQLGHLLKLQGRWDEAADAYAQVLRLDPDVRDAGVELDGLCPQLVEEGDKARDAQNWLAAARYYQRAVDRQPYLMAIWVQLGHAYKEHGDYPAAEAAYRRALALDGSVTDTHLQLGHLLKLQMRHREAIEAYCSAFRLASNQLEADEALDAIAWLSPLQAEKVITDNAGGPLAALAPNNPANDVSRAGSAWAEPADGAEPSEAIIWLGATDWPLQIQHPERLAAHLASTGARVFFASIVFGRSGDKDRVTDMVQSPHHGIYEVRMRVTDNAGDGSSQALSKTAIHHLQRALAELVATVPARAPIAIVRHPVWQQVALGIPGITVVYDCPDPEMPFGRPALSASAEPASVAGGLYRIQGREAILDCLSATERRSNSAAIRLLQLGQAFSAAGDAETEIALAGLASEINQSEAVLRNTYWVLQRSRRFEAASQVALKLRRLIGEKPTPRQAEFLSKLMASPTYLLSVLDLVGAPHPPTFEIVSGRICYCLHNSLPYSSGGYAARAHGLAGGLNQIGFEVIALTRPGFPVDIKPELQPEDIPASATIDCIRYERVLEPVRAGRSAVEYITLSADVLERRIKELRPAVIMAASNHVTALPALIAARRLGLPFIYEVRGLWEITRFSRERSFEQTAAFETQRILEAAVARHSEHVFTLTEALKEELVGRGVPHEKITLLPNSCDPERFVPMVRDKQLAVNLGIPEHVPVIGYVGTFVDYEGLEDLAIACGLVKKKGLDFRLLLVGNENASGLNRGPITEQIAAIAAEQKFADWLIMPGRVPHEEVERYYSLIDICPFPRKPWPVCEMVSPLKPLEALAMEKAVIVSSVRALAEMIEDGKTGMVFEKGDVEALAGALSRLLIDHRERERIGSAGRAWVLRERTWSATARTAGQELAMLGGEEVPSNGSEAKNFGGAGARQRHEAQKAASACVPLGNSLADEGGFSTIPLSKVILAPEILQTKSSYLAAARGATGRGTYSEWDWTRISYVFDYLRAGGRALDVGVGSGQLINTIAASGRFASIVGIDVTTHSRFIRLSDAFEIKRMSVAKMSFDDNFFDVVTCLEVLEHLDRETFLAALGELRRVCRGQLLMTVPFEELDPIPAFHKQRFDRWSLREYWPDARICLLEGFKVSWALIEEICQPSARSEWLDTEQAAVAGFAC